MYWFCCVLCRLDCVHINMKFLCILSIYTESEVRSSFTLCSRSQHEYCVIIWPLIPSFDIISIFMTISVRVIVIDYILYTVRLVCVILGSNCPHISLRLEARRPKHLMVREIMRSPVYTPRAHFPWEFATLWVQCNSGFPRNKQLF
jgi:hypothetical protein